MRPFLHRDPGIVGAALARDDVIVPIILDGIHLAPETARVAWRAARGPGRARHRRDHGRGRRATASYSLGNLDVHVHEGTVRGPDGVLAGSVLTMIEAVRNLHALGVPLAEAVAAATSTPARVLGEPGARPARRRPAGRHRRPRRPRSRSSACSSAAPCTSRPRSPPPRAGSERLDGDGAWHAHPHRRRDPARGRRSGDPRGHARACRCSSPSWASAWCSGATASAASTSPTRTSRARSGSSASRSSSSRAASRRRGAPSGRCSSRRRRSARSASSSRPSSRAPSHTPSCRSRGRPASCSARSSPRPTPPPSSRRCA